jgi:phage tail protein X
MTSEYVEYITRNGDRLDLISYAFYGNFYQYAQIALDNPDVLGKAVLGSGIVLKIPVLPATPQLVEPSRLPPWKR